METNEKERHLAKQITGSSQLAERRTAITQREMGKRRLASNITIDTCSSRATRIKAGYEMSAKNARMVPRISPRNTERTITQAHDPELEGRRRLRSGITMKCPPEKTRIKEIQRKNSNTLVS